MSSVAIDDAAWVFSLNDWKSNAAWAPYSPFTLMIEDAEHLWRFVRGSLVLTVVLDPAWLVTCAKASGADGYIDLEDEHYPFKIGIEGADQPAGVAAQLITRIALELVSPKSIVAASVEILRRTVAEATGSAGLKQ
jgi:hypothetical protein